MRSSRGLVLGLMALSLGLGITAALVHHFLYDSLDGKRTKGSNEQQWYVRIGTGLAFITKTLFTAAMTMAYAQILWFTLKSRSTTLKGLDSMFGVVHDVFLLRDAELWAKRPVLGLVALVIWTLPLMAIVTPATLTVQPSVFETIQYADIPSISWNYTHRQWAQFMVGGSLFYNNPSYAVSRHLSAVAAGGAILPAPAPHPNSTYIMDFYGPSLSCQPPTIGNSTFVPDLISRINSFDGFDHKFSYVAFVPIAAGSLSDPLDLVDSSNSTNTSIEDLSFLGLQNSLNMIWSKMRTTGLYTVDHISTDHARLFIAVEGEERGVINSIIECGLFNTSYSINFTFSDGQQAISVVNQEQLNGVSQGTEDGPWIPYFALLDSLGRLLLGILFAAGNPVGGQQQAQVANTVLMDAIELQQLSQLHSMVLSQNFTMREAVEDIFLNATMSLFSYAGFLEDVSQALPHPIITRTFHNVYIYTPSRLLAAYIPGIVFTTIVTLAGLLCILRTNSAFEMLFSTILRTTRDPTLDAVVPIDQTQGSLPISKQLETIKLALRRKKTEQGIRTAFAVTDCLSDPASITEQSGPSIGNDHFSLESFTGETESTERNGAMR